MAVVLALSSALIYGLSDFLGGVLSRRAHVWSVAFVAQSSAAVSTLVIALLAGGHMAGLDFFWGCVAGIGGGMGSAFLYRGLAAGRMTVVAPLSAVGSALLPVAVGVLAGERPSALTWLGVLCAFPAIWLVSRSSEIEEDIAGEEPKAAPVEVAAPHAATSAEVGEAAGDAFGTTGEVPPAESPAAPETVWAKARRTGVLDGLLAGVGFGMLFTGLGQVGNDAGLMPVAVAQFASLPAIVVLATALRVPWWPRDRQSLTAVVVGPLGAAATGLFYFATQFGMLSISAVLSSLYPASTVVLAAVLLHERIHRGQAVGLVLAAVAVSLVAAD